jgi:hypothetical protein
MAKRVVASMAESQNENPPRISPGGPMSAHTIAATSTSVASSSVMSNAVYIVAICDLTMTRARKFHE